MTASSALDLFAEKLRRLRTGAAARVLDICGGAGGFSLGFQSAGYCLAGAIESDPIACSTYARNLHREGDESARGVHAATRDLAADDPEVVASGLGLDGVAGSVDVLLAGLPCQAFARIGRSKLGSVAEDVDAYRKDPRATLYRRFLQFVEAFKPLAIVLENVPDILNHGGHNVPEEISIELEAWGYACRYTLLNAANYGVPQLRERLFLMALHKSLGVGPVFPSPTHQVDMPPGYASSRQFALKHVDLKASHYVATPQQSDGLPRAVTVRQAIADLSIVCRATWVDRDPPPSRNITETSRYLQGRPGIYATTMRHWDGFRTQGFVDAQVVRHTPRDYVLFRDMSHGEQYPAMHSRAVKRFEAAIARRRRCGEEISDGSPEWWAVRRAMVPPYDPDKFPNKWRKLEPDRPSCTLTAHLGKDAYSHIHYDSGQTRTISVREAARLQSFPDGFMFSGTMNSAFRQIGNAVPPLVALAIATRLAETLRMAAQQDSAVHLAAA